MISLIPQLKGEKRDGTSASDPYVAFRRRTEKMQTRKVNNVLLYKHQLNTKRAFARKLVIFTCENMTIAMAT